MLIVVTEGGRLVAGATLAGSIAGVRGTTGETSGTPRRSGRHAGAARAGATGGGVTWAALTNDSSQSAS